MPDPRLVHDLEAVLDLPAPRHRVLAYRLAEDVLDGRYVPTAQGHLAALLVPRRWRRPDPRVARDGLETREPDELIDALRELAVG